jgi:hypothetical protein
MPNFILDHLGYAITLIAGSGITGLWVLWRDRIRVVAKLVKEGFDIKHIERITAKPQFEVENLGARQTSLASTVNFVGYGPINRERIAFDLKIEDLSQRILPPCEPTVVTAQKSLVQAVYDFTWYRTYTFRPTRGRTFRVRLRNAEAEHLGIISFYLGLVRFKLFGKT